MIKPNLKSDFPIFQAHPTLCYLDSAATSQKPQVVIDRLVQFYEQENANIHRGLYDLSEKATALYDESRQTVADFIGADSSEIIFVRNATEGINLIAHTFGQSLTKKDTILLTYLEHHANIVPWQLLQQRNGVRLETVNIHKDGTLNIQDLDKKLAKKPKLLCVTHISNAIGTINPIADIIKKAHAVGTKVLVDASQSVPHLPVDITELEADFLVFTGHKMCGPNGVGVLYVKKSIAENMPPFLGGGDMIASVSFAKTTFLPPPQRFEAGTPAIADAIALGAAVNYLKKIGLKNIRAHAKDLFKKCWQALSKIKGLTLYGPADPETHAGIISFNMAGVHPHDIAEIFNQQNIAIRAGHHCAEPLITKLEEGATARLSFYLYNDERDIERVVEGIRKVKKTFGI